MNEFKSKYLKLGEKHFELKENESNLSIRCVDNAFNSVSISLSFEDGEYNEIPVSPYIEINNIEISINKLEDLKGILFEINNVDKSFEREDIFYLNESEPFVKYKIEILEIDEYKAHIMLNRIGITDGYSDPYMTDKVIVDAIVSLKIINIISNDTNCVTKNKKQNKSKVKNKAGIFSAFFKRK